MIQSRHVLTAGALALLAPAPVLAEGAGPGGIDILHVPLSWCAVAGSPAASAPSITGLDGVTDTTTDAVLWRRHERPTDNIWLPQATISFRSAINNSWGTLNFPVIADPDPTVGSAGDVRGEDVNVAGVEFNAVIAACDAAWDALGQGGIGVTAVNVNLFVTATGDYLTSLTPPQGTPIGWGGCVENTATGLCVSPLDARIAVADNFYLYPTVPDRSWPPSPLDPGGTFQYGATDPLDQLVGHELGHALGLAHAAGTTTLMFAGQQDNDADGDTDNIALSGAETTQARNAALVTPGLEADPPNVFLPGRFARTRLPDAEGKPDAGLEGTAFLDLAAVGGIVDTETDTGIVDIQLGGTLDLEQAAPFEAWVMLDVPGVDTGQAENALRELGFPEPDGLGGTDLVVRAQVLRGRVRGQGFAIRDGVPFELDGPRFELLSLVLHPYYALGFEGPDLEARLFDVIRVTLPPQVNVLTLDRPFGLQAFTVAQERVVDRLDPPRDLVIRLPSFPHCFPEETGVVPGTTTPIRFDGLRPGEGVHGLIGPSEVVRGTADAAGAGRLLFPVPADTSAGLHLITIGTDGTALTADCTLSVARGGDDGPGPRGPLDEAVYSLVKSHERLLHDQQRLLELFGEILHELVGAGVLPAAAQVELVEGYRQLLDRQTALIERFEAIVAGAAGAAER